MLFTSRPHRYFSAWPILFGLLLASSAAPASTPASLDAAQAAHSAIISGVAESGQFEFIVQNVGRDRRNLYLNSEADYRSPTCLTVVVRRGLWTRVAALVGGDVDQFVGQRIRVNGKVAREKIYFLNHADDSSRRYYHQAHLKLAAVDDLQVLPER